MENLFKKHSLLVSQVGTEIIREAMTESGTQNAKIMANGMNVYKVRVVHF